MTSPLLLEHFDELISTPDDVEKLNRSILQLAMQGKLVEQNSNDEPSRNLFKRISQIRLEIGNKKAMVPLSENDELYDLPESWLWTHLGDICQIVGGGTPRTNVPGNFAEEGVPWVTPADLYKIESKTISRGRRDISEKGLANSSARLIPAGSVLFSSRAPIGYVAIAANEISTNQGFKSCVPFLMELNEYIYYFLKFSASEIDNQASGTTFKEVSGSEMQKILIPLPPLTEQKRIVARIEELFSQTRRLAEELSHSRTELDRLNESALARLLASETQGEFNERWSFIAEHFDLLTSVPEHIAPLRQSILELAVRGKLTRREAGDESAGELLKRIKEEKDQILQSGALKYIKEHSKSLVDLPFELPSNWVWSLAQDLFYVQSGNAFKSREFTSSGIRLVRNVNIGHGSLTWKDVVCLPAEQEPEYEKFRLNEGDILISLDRPIITTGLKVAQVSASDLPSLLVQRVGRVIFWSKQMNPKYVYLWFLSSLFIDSIDPGRSKGIPHISQNDITKLLIPLPPLAEQERIVKRVEQLLGWCDALEAQLAESARVRGRLVESVLAKVGG